MWTPHPWCPAVAGSGWRKSSVNEVQIQYKNKNKKPECVCGESSPHSKYNESIHYFSLKSFPIFSACIIAFSFSPSLSRVYFKHLSKAPDDRLFTLQSGVEHPQMHQPLKSSGEERRGEGERERDLRSSRLGYRCVQQKDEKQLTSLEWKKKDHLDSVAKCYPLFVLAT